MKSFAANFTIEKNKKIGGKPRWILRLTVSAVDYYLAASIFTIPSFVGSTPWPASTVVNTLAWVQQFGDIVEGINGALDEFHISETSSTFIIDRSVTTNIETLALYGIEGCVAELYKWYIGCTDPPQRIWVGKVRAVAELTDTTVSVAFQDDSIDLENYYIGRKLALADYAGAEPNDIGKVIPIPLGTVAKIPALCVHNTADYVYMFSDRAVTTVSNVYARNNGIADININGYCTTYTGQTGYELTGYEGKGVVKITAAQAAQIQALVKTHITDAGHSHIADVNSPTNENTTTGLPTSYSYTFTLNFPADGARTYAAYSITLLPQFSAYNALLTASVGGTTLYNNYVNMFSGSAFTFSFNAGSINSDAVVVTVSTGIGNFCCVTAASRNILLTGGNQTSTDNASVSLSTPDLANAVSEQILVDAISDCGNPTDAASYITNAAGKADITISGTLTTSTINGLINEYNTALWWLNKMAFECGAWFAFINGAPKFISRQGSGSSKTIAACQIDGSGKRVLSRVKTDIYDMVNNITILYDRDWTQDESDKAYLQSTKDTAGDGLHERPDLFRFWFVTDSTSASAALALYLDLLQTQKWLATSTFFLDQSEMEFGDEANLSFISDTGIIISASHSPGSFNKIHTISLKVLI